MAERLPAVDQAIRETLATPILRRDGGHVSAAELIALLEGAGAACYVSGGCVRDALQGERPNDVDITVSIPIAAAKALLADRFGEERILIFNPAFGVCRVGEAGATALDINMMRDVDSVAGQDSLFDVVWRLGDSLLGEARVRDFTINSLFWSDAAGLIDPTGLGLAHNRSRTLSLCADPRKAAIDPRLAFRLALFAGKGFRPDAEALAFFRARIDGDVSRFGPSLAPYLGELTRGSAALRRGIAEFAAANGAGSDACRRLAETEGAGAKGYASYLAPGTLVGPHPPN